MSAVVFNKNLQYLFHVLELNTNTCVGDSWKDLAKVLMLYI